MNNSVELWKKHPDIDKIEVSKLGRVRTLDRVVSCRGNGTRFVKGRILKQRSNNYGYLLVNIPINGKQASKSVHRLVAQTFIPNPENFPQVNHKDCNPQNNNVSNLEWCTSSYDAKYREKHGISRAEVQGHPLFAVNLSTLEVSHFRSQGEAGRALGFNRGNIGSVIRGKTSQTNGFWFVSDDSHAVDVVKGKLHDIGRTGLKMR